MNKAKYIVSEVPYNRRCGISEDKLYYCHNTMTPDIPVFGSIGDKAKANKVCRYMNSGRRRR